MFIVLFFNTVFVSSGGAAIINARSCSNTDVQSAITSATSGDTVNVPAGTCIWTSTVSWQNKGINLIGAGSGTGGTQINSAVSPISSNVYGVTTNRSRISGFRFYVTGSVESAIIMKGQGWRIDHNSIENHTGGSLYSVYADGANTNGVQPYGLIDNNYAYESRIFVRNAGSLSAMNIAWADDSAIGTGNAVYFEDNIVNRSYSTNGVFIDANYGGKFVYRYNTMYGPHEMHAHSVQMELKRATRSWEIYGNLYNSPSTSEAMFIRGGTGMIFGNYISGSSKYSIAFDNVRNSLTAPNPVGKCDGSSAWDGNILANGWPCRDQIGRGKDTSLSTSEYDMKPQTSEPAYLWSNRVSTGSAFYVDIRNGSDAWIVNNRDYYDYNPSFNGTFGTGCGTLSNRPATCTKGVGYWATDQSCSNLSGSVGANPSAPISGKLYKCVSTNTWSKDGDGITYTPYQYPHPLRFTTNTTTSVPPAPPQKLRLQ